MGVSICVTLRWSSRISRFIGNCFPKEVRYEQKRQTHPSIGALLEEVNYDTSVYDTSNQKYNDYIQIVIDKLREKFPDANFREKYTSHNFRDTFISIAVQKNVSLNSILLWVGQSSYAVMDRYVELRDDFNRQEMTKLESKRTLQEIIESNKRTAERESVGEDVDDDLLPSLDLEMHPEELKELNKFKDPI